MKISELEKYEEIEDWIDGAADNTKKSYLHIIGKYAELSGLNPEQLVEEADTEQDMQGYKFKNSKLSKHLKKYKRSLKERNLSPNTIRGNMAAIKSFYEFHEIVIKENKNKRRRKSEKIKPKAENTGIVKMDEIRRIFDISSTREKAIISLGVSSGLAVSDIVNLKVGDV
jgi:site-specific recombinase XerD